MMMGKKVTSVFFLLLMGCGFFSATAAIEEKEAPEGINVVPKVKKVHIVLPKDIEISFSTNPDTGCIQDFFDLRGNKIEPKKPKWLKEGKEIYDFGSFTNSVCREGIISVGGSPIEYWGYANGSYTCLGAYDPACNEIYIPCKSEYPSCP